MISITNIVTQAVHHYLVLWAVFSMLQVLMHINTSLAIQNLFFTYFLLYVVYTCQKTLEIKTTKCCHRGTLKESDIYMNKKHEREWKTYVHTYVYTHKGSRGRLRGHRDQKYRVNAPHDKVDHNKEINVLRILEWHICYTRPSRQCTVLFWRWISGIAVTYNYCTVQLNSQ